MSDELMKQAKAAINENDETRADDIEFLREMVQKEVELSIPTTDEFLLRFLRAELFNRDRALQLVFKYYKFRLKYENNYKDFYPSALTHAFQNGSNIMNLPATNPEQGLVVALRPGCWKTDICCFDDFINAFHLCVEIAIRDEAVQIGGIRIVLDFQDFGLRYLPHTPIATLIRLVSIVQEVFPARFKGLHFIRQTRAVSILYSLMKPFLSESLKRRLFFHGTDFESLFTYIPAEILPKEFGGAKPPIDNSSFLESILLLDEYFKESNQHGYKK